MEDSQVIGLSGIEVPNSYRLYLAPADLERFSDYSTTLARELSRYLLGYARERGLRPVGEPRIELLEDAHQRRGRVRAEARFVDLPPARKSEVDAAVQGTRQLRLADLASFGLDVQAGVVRMGRAPDNDVTIDNQRVSRYHAQLRLVESSWLVYDLDSTNGTFVDQQRVLSSQPQVLRPGSTLRLGDHDLSVAEASQD
jgi:hypothetical protein